MKVYERSDLPVKPGGRNSQTHAPMGARQVSLIHCASRSAAGFSAGFGSSNSMRGLVTGMSVLSLKPMTTPGCMATPNSTRMSEPGWTLSSNSGGTW